MKKLIVIIVFVAHVFVCYAQDSTYKVSIASPTAASLGKYGDIPVNYNTGIPDVSIPIYTAESGNLKLPVNLSYHASGLKVEEYASWVGAGWSLNAGGVIIRTVIGEPDDRGDYTNNKVTKGYYSDYGYDNYLWEPGTDTYDNMVADDQMFASGYKDGEPDLFFFNFCGYSGKFYFNDDRTPVFIPKADFKVTTDFIAGTGFKGFIIQTSDGTKYYFGKTGNTGSVDPIEATIPNSATSGVDYTATATSSWFLNKIISADGQDSIKLSYQKESYSNYTLRMFPVQEAGLMSAQALISGGHTGYDLVKNFITGVRLSEIDFNNGSIIFSPSSSPRSDLSGSLTAGSGMYDASNTYNESTNPYPSYSLGKIQITDNNGFCKNEKFFYSYLQDQTPIPANLWQLALNFNIQSDEYTLRLDSIKEVSCDNNTVIPAYVFNYFNDYTPPRKLTFGFDHWGFANGVTSNQTPIPTLTLDGDDFAVHVAGANRESAWPAMRGGSLESIKYPTGGTTTFDYEANTTYSSSTNYVQTDVVPSLCVGCDGSQSFSGYFNTSPSSGLYEIDFNNVNLTNNTGPNSGSLVIKDPSNNVVANLRVPAVTPGTYIAPQYFNLSQNTHYTYTFSKDNSDAGRLQGSLTQWVATTTSGNVIVGGLRIKTITNSNGATSNDVVTSYSYNAGSNSSGILYSRPVYIQALRNDAQGYVWPHSVPGGCPSANGIQSFYMISPGSVLPMATDQGYHIGYNQVTVSQTNNGSTIYYYYGSPYWDNKITDVCKRELNWTALCDPSIPNYPYAPLPLEFKRGELKHELINNQSGHTVKEIWNTPTYVWDTLITPAYICAFGNAFSCGNVYNLQSYYKIKDSTATIDYDMSNGSFLTTIHYSYYGSRFHHQLIKSLTYNSKGDSLITKTRYAADYRYNDCDAYLDAGLSDYLSQIEGDSATFFRNITTCSPQSDHSNNCRYTEFQNMRRRISLARIAFSNQCLTNFSGATNQFTIHHNTKKSNADQDVEPILALQDQNNNEPIEITQWKNNSLIGAQLKLYKDYGNDGVYINKLQKINLTQPSSSFTVTAFNGSNFTKDTRYLDENSYLFNGGNLVELTPKNGLTESYIWDYHNSLPVAEVRNADSDEIAYTSFEADGKGNWSYSGTPLNDNDAAMGNKSYTLSGYPITLNPNFSLSISDTFVVSYWSRNASNFNISGEISGSAKTGDKIRNDWTYHEHLVTHVSNVTVSFPTGGSGSSRIDELRLYPLHAQMATYTYEPLIGMTSQCDINNKIIYYEYDGLGRLDLVRDQDTNVIKKYCYNYAGQQSDCNVAKFYNVADTAFDMKQGCPSGQTGTVAPYIVKAGTYNSSYGQNSADQQAQNDIAANAQDYANTNGTCISNVAATVMGTNSITKTFSAVLVNLNNSSLKYIFTLNASSTNVALGSVPAGTYNIQVSTPNNTTPYNFKIHCYDGDFFTSGSSMFLYNANMSSSASITISTNQQP